MNERFLRDKETMSSHGLKHKLRDFSIQVLKLLTTITLHYAVTLSCDSVLIHCGRQQALIFVVIMSKPK